MIYVFDDKICSCFLMSIMKNHLGKAFTIGIDLFSGICVGVILGFFFDKVFDTKPVCIIIFFFLGSAAGFNNIYKYLKNNYEK